MSDLSLEDLVEGRVPEPVDAAPLDAPVAPSEPAAEPSSPTPDDGDDLERILAEYDRANLQPAVPEAAAPEPAVDAGVVARQELVQQAAANLGLDPTAVGPSELEKQVWVASERKHFNDYATSIQQKLPDHLGDDYARRWLLSEAATDPQLRYAWDFRNVDPGQARAELYQVQLALDQLRRNPVANATQAVELQQYGEQLSIAVNARSILRQAENRLLNEAKKSKRPIDPDATADRFAVVQAVRGKSTEHVEEPPVDYGQLDNQQMREEIKRLGFDPGF